MNLINGKISFYEKISYNIQDLETLAKLNHTDIRGMINDLQSHTANNILDIIKDYDVVLLQEAFRKKARKLISKSNIQFKSYGRYSRIKFPFGIFFKRDIGDGLIILSRYPIVKSGFSKFKSSEVNGKKINRCEGTDCWARKGVQFVRIKLDEELELDFYNTHLNSGGGSANSVREIQINQIQDFINLKSGNRAYVLAGDFNSPPKGDSYKKLMATIIDGEYIDKRIEINL